MTQDELTVLNMVRELARTSQGTRVTRQAVLDKVNLPTDRATKALDGLDRSGHVWLMGTEVRLGSAGSTYDT
ncbi:MAG TPA: hypothetical protein VJ890_06530 [Vineibacter sp.]|nr:hypothetical protein [Vineibacter sp.]